MKKTLRLALGQIDVTVGDLRGNARKIIAAAAAAMKAGADLVAFPELAIPGYPPEDLLLSPDFLKANRKALEEVARQTRGITAIIGFAEMENDIYNAAAVLHGGEVAGVYRKIYLPNYGVFDENRYFQSGEEALVLDLAGTRIGVSICEDIWHAGDPTRAQCLQGHAQVIINISSSPFHAGKRSFRQRMLAARAWDYSTIVAYVNLVGGQDELVFDGGSMILDQRGELIAMGRAFAEDLLIVDLDLEAVLQERLHDPRMRKEKLDSSSDKLRFLCLLPLKNKRPAKKKPLPPRPAVVSLSSAEEIYRALTLGTADYVGKNGFQKVVIGLSGGIDSSLTATIAADALGRESVIGVAMPSMYSSPESLEDARILAENLGIQFQVIPIGEILTAFLQTLKGPFAGEKKDVTEENLQARIRGSLLMALSNKFGWLVLNTGNKSETGVGYCTLYGDMAGGFAVIKDVPKTWVYRLADYRNSLGAPPPIPARVIEKAPSAELRPNQKDTDFLPPYEILDPILQAYVEEDKSPEMILTQGYPQETVSRVIRLVDCNEYKRRQAAPGIKITPRAFGKDRRLPITNRYRQERTEDRLRAESRKKKK